MPGTGIIWDPRFLAHDTGPGHPERPERLITIKTVFEQHPELVLVEPRAASVNEVQWVHSAHHVRHVLNHRGVAHAYFDGDTPVGAQSVDAAFLAVGGVLALVEKVETAELSNGFAFPRPPGHHAEAGRAMGFCLFNNIAVAAEYLLHQHQKSRIAIMDYDVHHGNGTQYSFYDRADVLYLSTHRYPFYPGTGAASEQGRGAGHGYTVNAPLDAMADDQDYQRAFDEQIVPAIDNYQPEFILVSAGFDAHARDPLGGMQVTQWGFRFMSRRLIELAKTHCRGKIAFVLEGGYDLKGLREGVEAVFTELS